MARKRTSSYDEQREAILIAAAQCFAEKGFATATLAGVAKLCGVSRSLVYYYYPSKEELLGDLVDSHNRRLWAICEEVRTCNYPPREELRALIKALLIEYRASLHKHAVLMQDRRYLPARSETLLVQLQRQILGRGAELVRTVLPVDVNDGTVKVVTMCMFSMVNWTVMWLRPEGSISYEDFAGLIDQLIEGGATQGANAIDKRARPTRPPVPKRKGALPKAARKLQ